MYMHFLLYIQVSIPVSREGTSGIATVSWSIGFVSLSSIESSDVVSLSGTAVLSDGSSVTNIEVEIVADDTSETDESMTISLENAQPSDTQRLRVNFTTVGDGWCSLTCIGTIFGVALPWLGNKVLVDFVARQLRGACEDGI